MISWNLVIFIIIKSTKDNYELAIEVSVSNELREIQCLSGTTAGHVRLERGSTVGFSLMREHDEYRRSFGLIKFLHWAIMGCIYYSYGYTCMLKRAHEGETNAWIDAGNICSGKNENISAVYTSQNTRLNVKGKICLKRKVRKRSAARTGRLMWRTSQTRCTSPHCVDH